MPIVAIVDCRHASFEPERSVLEPAGVEIVLGHHEDAEVLCVQYAVVDGDLLDRTPRCRGVVRYGVGYDSVDVEAATARGVWVVNVPDYGTAEVADHALALILGLLRGVTRLDRAVRGGDWDFEAGGELRRLSELTLGVVGCGRIGSAVVERAAAFGFSVLGTDVRAGAVRPPAAPVPLAELLERSDVVTLHAPLDETTRHLIDADALARMRPGAFLVNTARGGLADGAAVLAALEAGRLAGAALDVLEAEPPADLDLVSHPRVIATPHAAWFSRESMLQLKREVAREALRVLAGERPRSPVNQL